MRATTIERWQRSQILLIYAKRSPKLTRPEKEFFERDDCAVVRDGDGVKVAVEGYVDVGDCEAPEEINAETDQAKEEQQQTPVQP